jgi:hypothetical protein
MAMARYSDTVVDGEGNVIAGAHIEVRREIPGQPMAAVYEDRDGTVGLGNPFDSDADGNFFFHAAGGEYQIRIYTGASGTPDSEYIRRYVPVGLSAATDDVGVKTQRTVTAAGTVTLSADDVDQININKTVGEVTRVVLPLSAERIPKKSIRVVDRKYDALTNYIGIVPKRPHVVTISIATPGVITLAAHGFAADQPFSLESTIALPTGAPSDTSLFVKTVLTANTFTFAATVGGAAIATTGSQSGVHTLGTDTIMGGAAYIIDSNGGSAEFGPLEDDSGWA